MLRQQLADGLRQLRALRGPVVDAVALEIHAGRVGARIVGAHHLDGAAVAGAILLDNNDAVVRLLAGAYARQTNHQHWKGPLKKTLKKIGSGAALLAVEMR